MKDKTAQSHRELELLDAMRRLGGSARSSDLAKVLDVSEETVRRAIKSLSKAGAVERVHGGAYLKGSQNDASFFQRIAKHSDEKKKIAAAVVDTVTDGMTIFLDVGSTTAFIAEELRRRSGLTVVTNSVGVAQTLVNHNGNRVHLLGGEMQEDERGTFGYVTERQTRRYAFDLAILSADALSVKGGFLFRNSAEADLSTAVAECADAVLFAMDHYKFENSAPHRGVDPTRVDTLISDQSPEGKLAKSLDKWSVSFQCA